MLLQPKIFIGNHNDLLPLLTKGMQATANLNTAALGDRSLYIGMSDIGRYLECPRATLANKLFATADQPLERLLPLQRGHWFEAGIPRPSSAITPPPSSNWKSRWNTKASPYGRIWILCLCSRSPQPYGFWR